MSDWQATATSCIFKAQGGFIISLIQQEHQAPNVLRMKSGEKSPFPFTLTVHLKEVEPAVTEGYIAFDGEVNTFMKFLVDKPLTNLFNFMAVKLQQHYDSEK